MTPTYSKKTALFPGTFDPFTKGHYSIVQRGLCIFDEIVIAIGTNTKKHPMFTEAQRIEMLQQIYANEPRVSIISYDGLTVDIARQHGAQFMLRGARSVIDFEYEKSMSDVNRVISGIETIVLFTEPIYAHISSSTVRELICFGHEVSEFLPEGMILPERNDLNIPQK